MDDSPFVSPAIKEYITFHRVKFIKLNFILKIRLKIRLMK